MTALLLQFQRLRVMHVLEKRQKSLCFSLYLDIPKSALLSNSLNQIKRDVIWLCPPANSNILNSAFVRTEQQEPREEISTVAISTLTQVHLKSRRKRRKITLGTAVWLCLAWASFKSTSHSYSVLFAALAATVKYSISCCNIWWWDMKSTVTCDSDVLSYPERRKLAPSTDLGHLHTHGENIWNCKCLNDQLSYHVFWS